MENLNPTIQIVRAAMEQVSKYVRKPKCVRNGIVKKGSDSLIGGEEDLI